MTYAPETEGLDIRAAFHLAASIGESVGRIEKRLADAQRLQEFTPVLQRIVRAGTYGSTPLILDFGHPDVGTYWDVESIGVGGQYDTTTAAGQAGVHVTAQQVATPDLSSQVDLTKTLPNFAFYGARDVLVQTNERLIVVVENGTATQQYVANVAISVYRTDAGMGRSVNIVGL